ncbi:hypothetical protein TIFTF001_028648 [Ficus carica]|uniref:Uncharacterized protein n=1 Tax=Ficus carica TaxID=3494 RepID=A0AA88J1U2_FICCA|nr:hypothetical protein TIFTF001_028648 [Ficus carica]
MVRFGSWFELDWAGRPNHSMTARHVVLAGRKLTIYVYAVGEWWLDIGAASSAWIGRKGFTFQSLFEASLDEVVVTRLVPLAIATTVTLALELPNPYFRRLSYR